MTDTQTTEKIPETPASVEAPVETPATEAVPSAKAPEKEPPVVDLNKIGQLNEEELKTYAAVRQAGHQAVNGIGQISVGLMRQFLATDVGKNVIQVVQAVRNLDKQDEEYSKLVNQFFSSRNLPFSAGDQYQIDPAGGIFNVPTETAVPPAPPAPPAPAVPKKVDHNKEIANLKLKLQNAEAEKARTEALNSAPKEAPKKAE